MSNWLPLALLTALCLAGYNFFIKLAADHLPPAVGAVVLQLVLEREASMDQTTNRPREGIKLHHGDPMLCDTTRKRLLVRDRGDS